MLSLCYEFFSWGSTFGVNGSTESYMAPIWCKKLKECIMNGISTPLLICFTIFFMKYNDNLQT
jgi:hypothetical protein